MELHIHNNEAAQLAYQLASTTGHSVEEEVLEALRARAQQHSFNATTVFNPNSAANKEQRLNHLLQIIEQCAALPVKDARTAEEIIGYDEYGLPN